MKSAAQWHYHELLSYIKRGVKAAHSTMNREDIDLSLEVPNPLGMQDPNSVASTKL